jgi:hypothetical protein
MSTLTRKQLLPDWLALLPVVDTPITLGEDTHHVFTEQNLPLPQLLADVFILPYEQEELEEEFTEYIPCFRLEPLLGSVHVCVYWRVSLMTYTYYLATYNAEGDQIDRAMIAGTYMREKSLLQRVAHINQELQVLCSEGVMPTDGTDFDLSSSVQSIFQISTSGHLNWHSSDNQEVRKLQML